MALRPRRRRRRVPRPGTIEHRFLEFHRDNPHVYVELVEMCWQFRDRGHRGRLGIGMLWETLRWNRLMRTDTEDDFKLNDHYRSHYARMIMRRNPELGDIFELRGLRTA